MERYQWLRDIAALLGALAPAGGRPKVVGLSAPDVPDPGAMIAMVIGVRAGLQTASMKVEGMGLGWGRLRL